ncbi:DUF4330 family protein [Salinirussus salinus]|jgi:hypothetical protein|uniref:DUF4330 family protein n=1 Tax=Salinirussus salinus TaxID=1198300 RepID=UPI00135BBB0F|nr:DUF4330 family protein [Salinirussus salinus]
MPIIDDEGRLFGTVNIIDALVVLFVLAVVVAGVALLTGGGSSDETPTRTVVVDVGQQPGYVIDAIEEGSVETSDIVAVENKAIASGGGNDRLRLTVTLAVTENADGLPTFAEDRLYVGRQVQLDLGTTIVSGTVIEMR